MDISKIRELDTGYESAIDYAESVINTYTKDLDTLVDTIKESIIVNGDLSSLHQYNLELPVKMYEISSKVEELGLKVDFAEINRADKYSRLLLNATGTIPEKQARATVFVNNEVYAKEIYERCYYGVKAKMESATQVLISLRALIQSLESEKRYS